MTQQDAVLQYIKDFGEITQNDAYYNLGITRLADVIYKLKKKGIKIVAVNSEVGTRYGKTEIAVLGLITGMIGV